MKKELLPNVLMRKLNEYEEDWREMSDQTFLTQVERLEIADEVAQKELTAAREKLKKKNQANHDDDAHGKRSNRADKDRKSNKRGKTLLRKASRSIVKLQEYQKRSTATTIMAIVARKTCISRNSQEDSRAGPLQ